VTIQGTHFGNVAIQETQLGNVAIQGNTFRQRGITGRNISEIRQIIRLVRRKSRMHLSLSYTAEYLTASGTNCLLEAQPMINKLQQILYNHPGGLSIEGLYL